MLTLNDGRSELWQWDTGRKLTVDADCSQVHFSNKVFGRSIDVDVVDGVAVIPDILLQTDKDLNVWAFVGTAENGYTKISKVFKVNKRNKPADYVFTPPEQTTLEEIKEKLDYLESIQDPDAIKNAVDEYLANNPIQIDEKDPTVPDWAKQTTKPKYTATEVGAVAKVNGVEPDANGNVEITIPDSGGNVDQSGLTAEQIAALDGMFKVCAFIKDDVSAEYNAFKAAFGITDSGEDEPDEPVIPDEPNNPEKTLTSISATYSGGDVPVGTAVSALTGIVVTAHYSDGTSEAVTGYTLSGTIAEGGNTVTVTYGGKAATFTVVGVAESGGEETGVSNESTWTNGVAYTFEPIANEYPNKTNGAITAYNNWARSPYLYCAGASILRGVVKTKSSQFAGTKDNAFYDADKNYVAPIVGTTSFAFNSLANAEVGTHHDVQIPENAAYFIVSGNNTMLPIDGEHLIEYVPYE